MITVGGRTFSAAELAESYPPDDRRLATARLMESGEDVFRFRNLDELKFELDLREQIVRAALDLYRSGLRFEIFQKSFCSEAFWDRTEDGGFRKKRNVSSRAAVGDIFENGKRYGTECATAMVIVYYGALAEIYDAELFDRTFASIDLMNWSRLDRNLREIGVPRPAKTILPGDRCYFKNPDVNPKTPEWQGENVIVLTDGFYYGHGIGIAQAPYFIEALNANRVPNSQVSAYRMDAAARPDFQRLHDLSRRGVRAAGALDWRGFSEPAGI